LLLAGVSGTAIYAFQRQNTALLSVARDSLPKAGLMGEIRNDNNFIIRYLSQASWEKNDIKQEAFLKMVIERIPDVEGDIQAIKKLPKTPDFKKVFDPVESEWAGILPGLKQAVALLRKNSMESDQEAEKVIDRVSGASQKMGEALTEASKISAENADVTVNKSLAASKFYMTLLITISIAGALAVFLFGLALASKLAGSLNEIAVVLEKGAEEVSSAATEIAASSEEVSASVTEQAAALQETAASIQEMSAMVAKNTENCSRSTDTSNESHRAATQGKNVVHEMIQAIDAIHRSNTETMTEIEASNRQISDIVQVIGEIANKTKVINDIVFQTKLLSFNASVEAARAGENGKGFAVVAEEVGNLAQMSGNAAKEISDMLQGSMQRVEGIVTSTREKTERLMALGKDKVEKGSQIAKQCGEVLESIVQNVAIVTQSVGEISTASQEQDHGIREITKAMGELDQATQQNSSACQQTASAAEELSAQSEILRSAVQRLLTTVEGEGKNGHRTGRGPEFHSAKSNIIPMNRPAPRSAPKTSSSTFSQGQTSTGFSAARGRSVRATDGNAVRAVDPVSVPSEDDDRFEDV
jgi:methyl-accepting chemotaxis protein